MGEIIPFLVRIILFPILKINFELLGKNGKPLEKDVFVQRPGSGRNNSISWSNHYIFCFGNNFELLDINKNHNQKEVFFIRGLKVGEIVPYPVFWINLKLLGEHENEAGKWGSNSVSCFEINFELLGKNEKHQVKEVFYQRPENWRNNSISCLDHLISCLLNPF